MNASAASTGANKFSSGMKCSGPVIFHEPLPLERDLVKAMDPGR